MASSSFKVYIWMLFFLYVYDKYEEKWYFHKLCAILSHRYFFFKLALYTKTFTQIPNVDIKKWHGLLLLFQDLQENHIPNSNKFHKKYFLIEIRFGKKNHKASLYKLIQDLSIKKWQLFSLANWHILNWPIMI